MGGIERGERNLTIQTVLTVAKGLGITMSELLSGIEKQADRSP
jgi:transcriptional regulator with XRE-family HTH domain